MSTPNIYPANHIKLVEKMLSQKNHETLPIIASFIYSSPECLNWVLKSNKVDEISQSLLSKMDENAGNQKVVENVFEEMYLLSSLATYTPIKEVMVKRKFPLEILARLQNESSLLIQYDKKIMKLFISLFQSTCIESDCAEEFAAKLIELMVKLPSISSTYHQYFIHEFFFPLINAYTGAPVSFIWKGVENEPLTKVTQILERLPIRSNEKTI